MCYPGGYGAIPYSSRAKSPRCGRAPLAGRQAAAVPCAHPPRQLRVLRGRSEPRQRARGQTWRAASPRPGAASPAKGSAAGSSEGARSVRHPDGERAPRASHAAGGERTAETPFAGGRRPRSAEEPRAVIARQGRAVSGTRQGRERKGRQGTGPGRAGQVAPRRAPSGSSRRHRGAGGGRGREAARAPRDAGSAPGHVLRFVVARSRAAVTCGGEDAAEAAPGCGRAQCSNGAAAVPAPHPDNFLLSDEIIANGFHSCDSDEEDRASHASSSDWTPRPRIGPYTFVQQHLMLGTDPRTILKDLLPETIPPPELDDMTLWQIVINILSEPPKRKKRKDINSIDDAVKLLQECKKIMVLTGAGVSVSCGIPDFRSRDGIYARLAVDFPDLPDPQAMFDIEYFRKDPRPFFKFAKVVPRCPRCPPEEPLAIMKPDIVFFGENLPEQFHRAMKYDKNEVDLLIVIGSSLKVRPVALIPSSIPHEVPQILINREPLPHLHFDVELLGDCDVIINELCQRLGSEYTKLCYNSVQLSEITEKPPRPHRELEALSAELPPTPLNISEGSSSPDRISPPHTAVVSEHPPECKVENCEPASETKGTCSEETLQDTQVSSENPENPASELMNSETMKENGSNDGENKEKSEILKKCWVNRSAKEQISKRLDGTQYLFLPPNRYIFHGAEVYSDSEDDIISSSSCGSSSESGSCRSQSLDVEDESEMEEFYNGIEDEDAPEREEEPGFGEDGAEQEELAAEESAETNEAAGTEHPSNAL
ncbi:NAD-dependent protein deacetylase sirtuin-1 isoform X2 [Onychostruthus taczanowskii]|uniref:NAD-dependent protein deacetylase sirtuin-1 isoform X2 n=1 Tax=Onychostruthus taczanowskii TaxID=356909 RepID=UPI001B809749|nr:NAD-dependent protein deacetylase sirtuin-1 isoform X2 [Onychostruthus taczanowskii]